jgi:Formate hydrogenlyase subunit 6/NADH:ubiquinone oxidoreductase 23 kD subunit (chain I)
VIGLLKSMATTMKHALAGETVTVRYPDEAAEVSARFRGVHTHNQQRCLWCRQCETVCPTDTIQIVTDDEGTGEQFDLNVGQCMYCRLCEEVCPVDALVLTRNFEVTGDTADELVYDMDDLDAVSWYGDTDPLAAREPAREAWLAEGDDDSAVDYQS